MFFCIDDEKLLEKYKTKGDKTTIRTQCDKVYTNFCDLNVPQDDIE